MAGRIARASRASAQVACAVLLCVSLGHSLDWSSVDTALQDEVAKQSFPGAVAGIVLDGEVVYASAHGSFTFGRPAPASGSDPAMTTAALFDMASLTKVLATTTSVMILYQRGLLHLDTRVSDQSLLGESFAAQGKGAITVRNLLLHNAGFPPDPVPGFWQPAFGCAESSKYHPLEVFSCQEKIYKGVLSQTLENPVGAKYVYSDLSMITMMFVVGTVAQRDGLVSQSDLLPACAAASSSPSKSQCFYEVMVTSLSREEKPAHPPPLARSEVCLGGLR